MTELARESAVMDQAVGKAKSPGADRKGHTIVLPGQAPNGEYILGVLVKRSYRIVPGQRCHRADADKKLIPGDLHYDDPMNSCVQFESDFVPFKTATDVVLNGSAYAPGARPIQSLTASITVGQHHKDVLVIGDRICQYRRLQSLLFTEPLPFTTMEIRYERAYGGVDIHSDPKMQCVYGRNHLGRGFVIRSTKTAVDMLPLPNIEDPKDPLTPERLCVGHFKDWEQQPIPQGFGWYAKFWQPRASLAGVMPADRAYEQQLRAEFAKVVPQEQKGLFGQTQLKDMDFRFFNGASQGLAVPFLTGNEGVKLVNLSPEAELTFQLPGDRPRIGLDIGEGVSEPPVVLHTVQLRTEDRELDLVWRGAVPYPGPDWLPEMKRMEVQVQ